MRADELSPGEVLVRGRYSSVNYKDALAGTGQGKILRRFPLNGGIDVAGHVVAPTTRLPRRRRGAVHRQRPVGNARRRLRRVHPARGGDDDRAAAGLSLRESMILGTAGFTAALSLFRMEQNAQSPSMGPIAVTGATGGVGMLAIDILARAGYEVDAITGKADHADFLRSLGASTVHARARTSTGAAGRWNRRVGRRDRQRRRRHPGRPVPQAAALRQTSPAADGGRPRSARHGDAAHHPGGVGARHASAGPKSASGGSCGGAWRSDWKPAHLDRIARRELGLAQLPGGFPGMLAGGSFGRTLVGI
jgi:hypothetical protein